MLLIQGLKDFKPFFLEILDKSDNKLEIKLDKKFLNGDNKEKPKLFQEFYLLIKYICLIYNVFHF